MVSQPAVSITARRIGGWLNEPLSPLSCVLGWCVATALFVGLVAAAWRIRGENDTYESVFSTWAIAHGQLTCAFPHGFRVIAPLYPMLSGGIAAIGHSGNSVKFPPQSVMGPNCDKAFLVINTWSQQSKALAGTLKIGYVSWPVLMAGTIAWLRAVGRGRCGWEPATLVLLACLPAVWTCVESTFHPEDLLAMGFVSARPCSACAVRGSWWGAPASLHRARLSCPNSSPFWWPCLSPGPRSRSVGDSHLGGVATANRRGSRSTSASWPVPRVWPTRYSFGNGNHRRNWRSHCVGALASTAFSHSFLCPGSCRSDSPLRSHGGRFDGLVQTPRWSRLRCSL